MFSQGFPISTSPYYLKPGVKYTILGGGSQSPFVTFKLRGSPMSFSYGFGDDSIEVDGTIIEYLQAEALTPNMPSVVPGVHDLNLPVMYRLYDFLGQNALATPASIAAGTAWGQIASSEIVGVDYEPWECFWSIAWGSAALTAGDIVAAVGLNGGPFFGFAVGPGKEAHGKISVPHGYTVWVYALNSDTVAHDLYYSLADHHP